MFKRYKSQQSFDAATAADSASSPPLTAGNSSVSNGGTTVRSLVSPASSSASSLKSVKGAVKRLRCNDDDQQSASLGESDLREAKKSTITSTPVSAVSSPAKAAPQLRSCESISNQQSLLSGLLLDNNNEQRRNALLQQSSKSLDMSAPPTDDNQCFVDVRLIDFAHTAFVPRNGTMLPTPAAAPVHHGPDGDSLPVWIASTACSTKLWPRNAPKLAIETTSGEKNMNIYMGQLGGNTQVKSTI